MIDIAPGAESSPLAALLAEQVRRNIARYPAKRAEFDGLRGAIAIVADDHGTALTLRFDFGRLVVHTGVVGVPDLTILGPLSVLEALGDLPAKGLVGLAWGELRAGNAIAPASPEEPRDPSEKGLRDLKVYGLWAHPLMVRRLLAVLSGARP